jgi:7-cyano-7-deazaguanine synthase
MTNHKILAIPLLSGGIDSAVATLIARDTYQRIQPVFIDWWHQIGINESHLSQTKERSAANRIAVILGIHNPYIIQIPFKWYAEEKNVNDQAFPYARNLVFLSAAASYAATAHGGNKNIIVVGFNKSDQGGVDASPEFVESFRELIRHCIENNEDLGRMDVNAPLLNLNKKEIIRMAYERGAGKAIEASWSCYRAGESHCGQCRNCRLRKEAFARAGIEDPTNYIVA